MTLIKDVTSGGNTIASYDQAEEASRLQRLTSAIDKGILGDLTILQRISQISARFDLPISSQPLTLLTTGNGTVTQSRSTAHIQSSSGSASLATSETTQYAPGREVYAKFAAAFPTRPTGSETSRIGIYDNQDGFFVGYTGSSFGITKRCAGIDDFTPQSAFNEDQLQADASSLFTRAGHPEPLDPSQLNVYRIRYSWLGASPIRFEILSPDGMWLAFHTIRFPNTSQSPSILNPNLPITAEVISSGTDLSILTCSWDAGIVTAPSPATAPSSLDVVDRAGRLVGHVTVDNLPATQPVSGHVTIDNLPATQPISGAVAVSNLPAIQPVSGHVLIDNFPAPPPVQPVSVSSLPAVDVLDRAGRVVGHVTIDNLPATQPVSGHVLVDNFPGFPAVQPVSITGTLQTSPAPASSYRHITTNGSVTCKSGSGVLRKVIVNGAGSAFTITITDGTGTLAVISVINNHDPVSLTYEIAFSTNLVVTTSGMKPGADITVTFD